MAAYHDEIEIEDMEYDEETETYYYPCPCGDRFQITKVEFCFVCTTTTSLKLVKGDDRRNWLCCINGPSWSNCNTTLTVCP